MSHDKWKENLMKQKWNIKCYAEKSGEMKNWRKWIEEICFFILFNSRFGMVITKSIKFLCLKTFSWRGRLKWKIHHENVNENSISQEHNRAEAHCIHFCCVVLCLLKKVRGARVCVFSRKTEYYMNNLNVSVISLYQLDWSTLDCIELGVILTVSPWNESE